MNGRTAQPLTPGGSLSQLVLLGEDLPELGRVAIEAPAPGIALALSAGRYPKLDPSVEANEDAVAVASDGRTAMLAVADGHHGFRAARAAIMAIHEHARTIVAESHAEDAVALALELAAGAVTSAAAAGGDAGQRSGTALTVAVARGSGAAVGSYGDTAALRVGGRRPRLVSSPTAFLRSDAAHRPPVRRVKLGPGHALLVMSDGAFSFHGRHWPQRVAAVAGGRKAAAAADAVVDAAFTAGAGDHIAVAVLGPRVL